MKKILIIYTGGTIGMQNTGGILKPFDFGTVTEQVPELKKLGCKLSHVVFDKLIDSSNVTPGFWVKLADTVAAYYSDHDGFIILHGTDTMAYSASALSFMLDGLCKPVIFTGSQLPLGAIRTDARSNLITSVELACGNVKIPEVCIYFNNQLFRGNRAEKYTSSAFDAFQSLNYPPLVETGVHIKYNPEFILPYKKRTLKLRMHLEPNIGVVRLFPGITKDWLEHILEIRELKGIVLETYGSGNAPSSEWFIDPLRKAINKGVVIVNVSQCSGGRVEQGKYETSKKLNEIGVLNGSDMTTEAAVTKLMVLLGSGLKGKVQIRKEFLRSWSGEISHS